MSQGFGDLGKLAVIDQIGQIALLQHLFRLQGKGDTYRVGLLPLPQDIDPAIGVDK